MGASADPKRGGSDNNMFSIRFDASRLRAALAKSGVACPPLDQHLIGTYVDAMLRESPA